jgi:hypothetical protein
MEEAGIDGGSDAAAKRLGELEWARCTAVAYLPRTKSAVIRVKVSRTQGRRSDAEDFVRRREEIGEILAAPFPKRLGQAVRAVLQTV